MCLTNRQNKGISVAALQNIIDANWDPDTSSKFMMICSIWVYVQIITTEPDAEILVTLTLTHTHTHEGEDMSDIFRLMSESHTLMRTTGVIINSMLLLEV